VKNSRNLVVKNTRKRVKKIARDVLYNASVKMKLK